VVEIRILFIAPYYYPYRSGATEYVGRIAEGLVRAGHEVTVLTSQHEKTLLKKEGISGVSVIRVPVLIKISKGTIKPLFGYHIIKHALQNDAVIFSAPMFGIGFWTLMLKQKKPVLAYLCDLKLTGSLGFLIEKIYYPSVKLALKCAEKITVLNSDYAKHCRVSKQLKKAVPISPPAPELHYVKPTLLRKDWGIGEDAHVIGFLGRLTPEKGVEYLIQALPMVRERIPDVVLVVAGEGEKVIGGSVKGGLVELAGRDEGIMFPGFIEEKLLPEFYSMCDVFVLPSVDSPEAFGMVQVEAMFCGTPVVASDIAGVRDVIKKTKMGKLVPPKNVPALADAIVDVIGKRRKYVVSREKILSEYGVSRTVMEFEALLREVAGE